MTQARGARSRSRRSREEWLEAALDLLSQQGGTRIRIRDLCGDLGVTTGSFYAHFRDRDEFIRSVATYWKQRFTTEIRDTIRQSYDDPKSRLVALAEAIIEQDLGRYDMAVRAWATQEPAIASIVKGVDEERLAILRDLFFQLGFRGAELEMRTRTFVTYYSLEYSILVPQSKRERLEQAGRRIDMLIRASTDRIASDGKCQRQ